MQEEEEQEEKDAIIITPRYSKMPGNTPTTCTSSSSSSSTKLDFSRIGHCGRHAELEQLVNHCRRFRPRPTTSTTGDTLGESHPTTMHGNDATTTTTPSQPRAILVEAESGTGKSELLKALCLELSKNPTSSTTDYFCCRGKFEERAAASEPFDALQEAMNDMLTVFYIQDQQQQQHSRDDASEDGSRNHAKGLQEVLGPSADLLATVFPKVKQILSLASTNNTTEDPTDKASTKDEPLEHVFGDDIMAGMKWQFERLRFAFRALIRYATKFRPVILVLDDLHWADPDSLQLILTLIQDEELVCSDSDHYSDMTTTTSTTTQSLGFCFVGASRPIEDGGVLAQLVQTVPTDILARMTVSKLSTTEIAHICSSLFLQPQAQVMELANCIQTKAGTNTFVVVQYLRLLEQKGFVFFDTWTKRWNWDLPNIQQEEGIHGNVKDVVVDNIMNLDERIKTALIVASSFGVSHFDVATIVHAAPVVENKDEFSEDTSSDLFVARQSMKGFGCHLEQAVQDGLLLEDSAPGRYKFSHDRIREAAYSLLPHGEKGKEMHLKIGRQLRSWMDIQGELGEVADFSEQQLLLHAVKQLNAGKELMTDDWEKLDLAELCFQAAELSARQSSFFSAMEYLQRGIDCLSEKSWQEHFDIKYKLHVALMRMQYTLAHLDACLGTASQILAHGRNFGDKKVVYNTMLLCMLQQHRAHDGIDLAFRVLEEDYSMSVPKRLVLPRAIVFYLKLSKRFRKLSNEEILGMPAAVDSERIRDMCNLILQATDMALNEGGDDFVPYGIFLGLKMMNVFLDEGAFPAAFVPFHYFANISFFFGDFKTADRCQKLELLLMERGEKQDSSLAGQVARCELLAPIYNTLGSTPLNYPLGPLRLAFWKTWKHGTLDYGFLDCFNYLRHLFNSGKRLSFVASECHRFSEILRDYKQSVQWLNNAPLHQAVLNLLGDKTSADITTPIGRHLAETVENGNGDDCKRQMAVDTFHYYTMVLAYHFYDHTKAKRMLKKLPSDIWSSGGDFFVPNRIMYTALVYTALCRTNTRKGFKYRRRAKAAMNQIKVWNEKGAANCNYMLHLLQAELLTVSCFKGETSVALGLYDKAIEQAKNLEVLHHVALANELAGTFVKTREEGSQFASKYLTEAVRYYEEWGSPAKAHHLRKVYGDLIGDVPISSSMATTKEQAIH